MSTKRVSAAVSKRKSPTLVFPAPNPQALSFSIKEAAAITGLAVWAIRSAIWAGSLPARLVGKRQIILRTDLERWLSTQPVIHRRSSRRAA